MVVVVVVVVVWRDDGYGLIDDLYPTLMRALEVDGPALVEVPIDYRENLRLTERLGALSGMA